MCVKNFEPSKINAHKRVFLAGMRVICAEVRVDFAHWRGDWRMPTKQEFDALNSRCDWVWTMVNGVNGYVVRGRGEYASNSIFLPCAGNGLRTSLNDAGLYGLSWSSVPYSDYGRNYYAWDLYFADSGYHSTVDDGRYCGQSVRPLQGFTK